MKPDADEMDGCERLFALLFADLGRVSTGEPGAARHAEVKQAVEHVHATIGSKAVVVVEIAPSGPQTIASAGHAETLGSELQAELVRRASEETPTVEHNGTLAVAGGDQPCVVVIAQPGADAFDRQTIAMLRLTATWLSSERRRSARLRGWIEQTHDDKYQSLSHFALRAAHDFRNSLAAILSHAEFVLDRIDENQISHQVLEDVVLAARQASQQVDTLMAFGGLLDSPVPQPVQLEPQINGMLPVLRALVPTHIELTTSIDAEAAAGIQPTHLRQLLVNLVTNAAQAIGTAPGHIELGVRVRQLPTPAAEIIVQDDGPGMESNVLRRATDPFFSTHKGNRGLGLAVAMGIARGVGGNLVLASEPGSGTRVQITIPRRPETSSAKFA